MLKTQLFTLIVPLCTQECDDNCKDNLTKRPVKDNLKKTEILVRRSCRYVLVAWIQIKKQKLTTYEYQYSFLPLVSSLYTCLPTHQPTQYSCLPTWHVPGSVYLPVYLKVSTNQPRANCSSTGFTLV